MVPSLAGCPPCTIPMPFRTAIEPGPVVEKDAFYHLDKRVVCSNNYQTEQGSVPLLIFSEKSSGKRQLTVFKHSLSAAPNFMAISHVRYLGLGSSTSNALPYCQLSRLQTLATGDEGIMPFWIDTMCIPRPRKARQAALRNAHLIFAAATVVLVIDPCLDYTVGSATEALLSIKHSNWAKRLWTIQEGALARKLCFQFSNRVWSIDDMLSEYERDRALDILHLLPCKRDRRAVGDDELKQMLARLDNDMAAAAENMLGHVEVQPFDQVKLRIMLRWGYLASPKFYWMVDKGKVQMLRDVVDVLEQVYAEDAGADETKSLPERLRLISAVDLNFEGDNLTS